MIVVRFRMLQPRGKVQRIEINESRDPFEVLQACIERIDALERSPATQAPCTARSDSPVGQKATPSAPPPAGSQRTGEDHRGGEHRLPAQPALAGVRDASMIAYRSLEWSGRMTKQQRLVMDFFAINTQRDFTRQELAQALALGVNVICGRVNELMRPPFALLEELGRRPCRITGESANALRAKLQMRVAA